MKRYGSFPPLAALTLAGLVALAPLHHLAPAGAAPAAPAKQGTPTAAAPAKRGARTPAAAAWFPPDTTVRALLQKRIDVGRANGLVVGLLENGRTRVIAAGAADGPGSRPLDGATVFEIGSVTKVFTTTLLAEMVGRGEVRFDTPVAELLPDSVKVPASGERAITLFDLATQRSGLPRLPANLRPTSMANPYADYTVDQLYEFLSGHQLSSAPGEVYAYSNLGMGLLGHALALKAGKSFEALLTERVLAPLGLQDTRITFTPDLAARLAVGHGPSGDVVGNWDLPTLAGGGALRSTVNDLLRFLAANLDSSDTPISAALRETHRPRLGGSGPNVKIALGWNVMERFGTEFHTHNGATGGYRSFVGYDPAKRVAVVLLSNTSNDHDDLALHLLNPDFPLKEFAKRTEVSVDPARLDSLVGQYALAPNFSLTVTREGGHLFVQGTGQAKIQAYAESDTTFFFKAVEAQVSFSRDATGRGTELVLHQGGRSTPAKRIP